MKVKKATIPKGLYLVETTRSDKRLLKCMAVHYSKPLGFVGRSICYAVMFSGVYYGHIVGGSATKHLPNRNDCLNIDVKTQLNNVVNNIFFHIEPIDGNYPMRNFGQQVLSLFRFTISERWLIKYGDLVLGFESLVELPRTGEVYYRDGWDNIGRTLGQTCKRTAGKGTDSWGGKRVWDKVNLRPKWVFVRSI